MVDVESRILLRKCSVISGHNCHRIQRDPFQRQITISKPSGVLEVKKFATLVIIRLGVDGQPTSFPGKAEGRTPTLFLLHCWLPISKR